MGATVDLFRSTFNSSSPVNILSILQPTLSDFYVPSTSDDDVKRATRRLRSLRPRFIIKGYSVYLFQLYNIYINVSQFITRDFSFYMEQAAVVLYSRKQRSCDNLFQF